MTLGLGLRKGLGIDIAIASFCLVLVAVMWIVTLEHIDYERQETVNSAIVVNSNLAMAFEEHTIRTLRGIDQTLLFIRHEYVRQGARLNIRRLVGNGLVMSDILLFIGVADERGNLVTASAEFRPTNLFDREYFQFHRQTDSNELSISKPLLGRVTGRWAIIFSHRINKPDGAFGGVVYAVVEPSYFNGFYEQVHLGEQGLAMLVGLDGITRARRAGSASTFGQDMRQSILFTEQAKRRVGSLLSEGRRDGVPRLVSYRTLGPYPLIVAVGTSQAEVLAPFDARARNYYAAASLGTALVVLAGICILVALARQRRGELARAHLASIVESNNDAICSRTHEGVITSWNDAAERMFGYTAAEAIGRNISIIIPPELREEADRIRAAMTAGDLPMTRDTVRCAKDGTRINVAITRSPIKNNAGEMIEASAIFHDITERKRAEGSLRTSSLVLHSMAEAVIYTDQQGTILFTNPAFDRIFGYEPRELIGQPASILNALPTEENTQLVTSILETIRNGGMWEGELLSRRKDGTVTHTRGRVTGMRHAGEIWAVGVQEDTTERKRMEDALRLDSEMLANLADGILLVRVRDATIIYASAQLEKMFGYPRGELIGMNISTINAPSDKSPEETAEVIQAALRKMGVWRGEVRNKRKDGTYFWTHASVSTYKHAEHGTVWVSVSKDITEQKKAQEALRESEMQLRHALEERERLSRDMHDGTVQELYAIGLGLEDAQRHISLDPRAASARLSDQVKNLNAVIRQIRKHIIDHEHPQLTGPQLHNELAAFANMAKSARVPQFRVDIDTAAASRLSPGKMSHVLHIAREAMSNSLRHSGGHNGLVSLTSNHDQIRLMVKDDGVGFAAEQARGRGNGLRNIEARVREIAGQLEVRAAPGHGAQIIVDIPAGDAHAA